MVRSVLAAWPMRRRVALAVLLPAVAAWFVGLGRGGQVPPSVAWYGVALLASVLGAAVLASYVPVVGRGLDLGCTPCATMSFLTLVGGSMAIRNYGADISGPLVAAALLLFGLTQRMSQPATCAAPVRGDAGAVEAEPVRDRT
ncbi:MAG TPA: hypothetical protein VFZ64_08685 [Nocardioidaceae bacterium]